MVNWNIIQNHNIVEVYFQSTYWVLHYWIFFVRIITVDLKTSFAGDCILTACLFGLIKNVFIDQKKCNYSKTEISRTVKIWSQWKHTTCFNMQYSRSKVSTTHFFIVSFALSNILCGWYNDSFCWKMKAMEKVVNWNTIETILKL